MPEFAIAGILGLLAAAGAALSRRSLRRAFGLGARCLARHPVLWQLPAGLSAAHVALIFLAEALLHARTDSAFPVIAPAPPPALTTALLAAGLPALEQTSAVFSIFVGTFPLAAWFALRLLFNADGLLGELARALRRRFGATAFLLVPALVLGALAALFKPVAYLLLPEISTRIPWSALLTLNVLASAFELLLGITLLTYLMLVANGWMRGLHFDRGRLRQFAMRRTGYVLKWSLVLLLAALVLVLAPLSLSTVIAPEDDGGRALVAFADAIGRPAFTVLALLCLPVQAILVFHNESLTQALRDGARFLRRHAFEVIAFLATGFLAFLAVEVAAAWLRMQWGWDTMAGFGVRFATALTEGFLAGWLIATWVSLYKQLTAAGKPSSP